MSQDPDLPAEQGSGDPGMVALLTALSQVNPSSKYIFEDLLGVSHMLNKLGIQMCTLKSVLSLQFCGYAG